MTDEERKNRNPAVEYSTINPAECEESKFTPNGIRSHCQPLWEMNCRP